MRLPYYRFKYTLHMRKSRESRQNNQTIYLDKRYGRFVPWLDKRLKKKMWYKETVAGKVCFLADKVYDRKHVFFTNQ